jgi:hypothetical protein
MKADILMSWNSKTEVRGKRDVPLPPDSEPPTPVEEPPDRPQQEPPAPVREPDPTPPDHLVPRTKRLF